MLDNQQTITKPIPRNLAAIGRMYSNTVCDTEHFEQSIRRLFGLSYEEYADAQNALLAEHGSISHEAFISHLFSRIMIDLMGRGYLRLRKDSTPNDIKITMTPKGTDRVIRALGECIADLPEEPYSALVFLRNMNLLDDQSTTTQRYNCNSLQEEG